MRMTIMYYLHVQYYKLQ